MKKVRIAQSEFEKIRTWSVEDFPKEACGFLIGKMTEWGWDVKEAVKVPNRSESDIRFVISPEDTLNWMKKANGMGLDIVGVWHSHPDYPPRPSQYDIESSFEGYVYIIVSVMAGKPAGAKAWELSPDGMVGKVEIEVYS